jgi:hypothetical protein
MSRVHFIENATTDSGSSGPYNIIIKQGSGAEVTIANGFVKAVYLDGAGSGAAVTEAFTDLSVGGNLLIDGATPTLTIGDAGAEDTKIVFDGNAQDFYIGLDDSADDLLVGLGSTVGTTPAIAIDENLLTTLHGGLTLVGTTPTLTIGDAGAEDTKIVFDGNAQDFYIGLDDSADDLIIGLGSTVGTTPIISVDENKDVAIPDGSLTITTADNTSQLTLTSTDADANVGPRMDLFRDSASPADDDILGQIRFLGDNDANSQLAYADIEIRIADASNGSEDGRIEFSTATGGTGSVSRMLFNATETVINEDSKDLDFRIESADSTHMFYFDAGGNSINFDDGGQTAVRSTINKNSSGARVVSTGSYNVIAAIKNGNTANTIDRDATIRFQVGGADEGYISWIHSDSTNSNNHGRFDIAGRNGGTRALMATFNSNVETVFSQPRF